jgi:hypothetical protein
MDAMPGLRIAAARSRGMRFSIQIAGPTPVPLAALCDKLNLRCLTIRADEVFLF